MKIIPVILCGGSGTRLWPISRTNLPKQFSDFFGDKTLFQKTILRFANNPKFSEPLIICNNDHRFIVASQLQEINVSPLAIILEPDSKNTACAIAIASLFIKKFLQEKITPKENIADATMLIVPSDHLIKDDKKFIDSALSAQELSQQGQIITFGIRPQYPETGYGYIEKGSSLNQNNNIFVVNKFIEKPSSIIAKQLIIDDKYYWNSGIFMLQSDVYLQALQQLEKEIFLACNKALEKAQQDLDFIRLDAEEFAKGKNISVDYAIIEKAKNIALMPLDLEWSDVGSWHAIANISPKNSEGNSLIGNITTYDTKNCYINSVSQQLIATAGLEDLIITATKDVILITHKNKAQNVKDLYHQVQNINANYCDNNHKSMRPWGSFEVMEIGDQYKVKKIIVNPFSRLSLQLHQHRAEHWVVVKGVAKVQCEEREFTLHENESTFIPLGKKHCLENNTDKILEIIEIQSGKYLEEDDIQRFNDKYGRI